MSEVKVVDGTITLFQATCPVCGLKSGLYTSSDEAKDQLMFHLNTHSIIVDEVTIGTLKSPAVPATTIASKF